MALDDLIDRLDLSIWTAGVCLPCLTFVAFPLDSGNEVDARREARRLTPELWADGLDVRAVELLEEARRAGVPGAAEALLDIRRRGARADVVGAMVWRLAELMVDDMRTRSRRRRLPEEVIAK